MQIQEMELLRKHYSAPAVRIGKVLAERAFLLGTNPWGDIDPGEEDPWGDF